MTQESPSLRPGRSQRVLGARLPRNIGAPEKPLLAVAHNPPSVWKFASWSRENVRAATPSQLFFEWPHTALAAQREKRRRVMPSLRRLSGSLTAMIT